MIRVISADLWPVIAGLGAKAERKHAAVAYVTSDEHLKFGKGDVLIADASDDAISGGRTSAAVLSGAFRRGASLYSLPDLHAKILCLSRFAVIGSANMSALSAESLVEAAVVTDHPGLLAEARTLVTQFQEKATPIDERFLERIAAIPVTRRVLVGSRRKTVVEEHASRTWLVGVHAIDEERYADEAELAEEGGREAEAKVANEESTVSWLRFTGKAKFRSDARPGDTVIQIWRRSLKSKTARVYFAAPIIHRQDEPTCTRFYIEAFSDEEARAIAWKEFIDVWGKATDASPPPLSCTRLLTSEAAERIITLWPV